MNIAARNLTPVAECVPHVIPPAFAMYGADTGIAIAGAGQAWLRYMEAALAGDLLLMQRLTEEIASLTCRANILAEVNARKISDFRRRNPNVRDD